MDLPIITSTSSYSDFQELINQVQPLTQVVLSAQGQNHALPPRQVLTLMTTLSLKGIDQGSSKCNSTTLQVMNQKAP
jgi:uncharacterized protein